MPFLKSFCLPALKCVHELSPSIEFTKYRMTHHWHIGDTSAAAFAQVTAQVYEILVITPLRVAEAEASRLR